MKPLKDSTLNPRKLPTQARANVTVDAIFTATIQVLLSVGYSRLTTTRVAERAGVSVGTLYQYFPHKKALLSVLLEQHLAHITVAIQSACQAQHGQTVREMMTATINAYISAEVARLDAIHAFGLIPLAEIGAEQLIQAATSQLQASLMAMLQSANDAQFHDLQTACFILVTGPIGTMQRAMQQHMPAERLDELRRHFIELSVGYLRQIERSPH